VVKTIGGPRTKLVQYENGHWQMMLDGKPILVKSVAYTPTVIGQSPDNGTLKDWTFEDYNKNGKIDGPYDAWVDKNLNNKQDPDELPVGDFTLLKEMGMNALRVYHHDHNKNKDLFRALYEDYGIMLLMGDFLGAYAVGSGATWNEGTDYANPAHQENMKASVKKMLEEYKDEPYILMWVLGNENNYGVANSAKKDPVSHFKFVNEVALMMKEIDPTRPIVVCEGDVLYLDLFAQYAPDVDIYGANSYRGEQGFGYGMWGSVKELCDKPVLITEYGCPAYQKGKPREISSIDQARYHQGEWEDILYNSAGYGVGNAIGGVVFEYLDEWWKAYEPYLHDKGGLYTGPFPGGVVYEEWFGIVGQGSGTDSPYLRQLRESYHLYKRMWNRKVE
jgi:beta-glucuronidase